MTQEPLRDYDAEPPVGRPVTLGEGHKVHGGEGHGLMRAEACHGNDTKPTSPDGYHHWTCVTNVQSVETFVCDHCDHRWSD